MLGEEASKGGSQTSPVLPSPSEWQKESVPPLPVRRLPSLLASSLPTAYALAFCVTVTVPFSPAENRN